MGSFGFVVVFGLVCCWVLQRACAFYLARDAEGREGGAAQSRAGLSEQTRARPVDRRPRTVDVPDTPLPIGEQREDGLAVGNPSRRHDRFPGCGARRTAGEGRVEGQEPGALGWVWVVGLSLF